MLQRLLVSAALMVFFSLPAAYAQLGPKDGADLKPTDLELETLRKIP